MTNRSLRMAISLALMCLASAPDAQVTWTDRLVAGPLQRIDFGFAYDPLRRVAVLFGGTISDSSTYEWDGARWWQYRPSPPPWNRPYVLLAWDGNLKKVLLWGGNLFTDTWTYDGVAWTQVPTTTSPPARVWSAMVFDEARAQVILYGGADHPQTVNPLGDTWSFDGASWRQLNPTVSPPPREDAAMAYDRRRQRVVIFGGSQNGRYLDETWEWDGATWTQRHPVHRPSPRTGCAMAYDAARARVVLFGGYGPQTLPLRLDTLGIPGCSLFTSIDVTLPFTGGGGTLQLGYTLPPIAWPGAPYFEQALVLDPAANAAGLTLSNARRNTIGSP